MRVFYLGCGGPLSLTPLQTLIDLGHEVCGLGVLRRPPRVGAWRMPVGSITLGISDPLTALARRHRIAVTCLRPDRLADDFADLGAVIRAAQAELIIVSCLPARLPDEFLAAARYGAINCHPSLLPAYRGPAPLFWQYRDGVEEIGVTVHQMTAQWDAGDIIATRRMAVIDGLSGIEINLELARLLRAALIGALDAFPDPPATAQDATAASYHGYPQAADFALSADWSARRMYNFMRATGHWGNDYALTAHGKRYALKHALAYSMPYANAAAALPPPRGDIKHIRCATGTVAVTLAHAA